MKNFLRVCFVSLLCVACFPHIGSKDFTTIYLQLANTTGLKECGGKEQDLYFAMNNLDAPLDEDILVSLSNGEQKSVQIEAKIKERVEFRVYRAADSTLILGKEVKLGPIVYLGGDPATKEVIFCDDKDLTLKYF